MGRYRAPMPPSSKFITPQGASDLRKELDFLWRVKRPQVTRAVSEAAAQGDRSENAEYIYGKKQLREIDRRVRFLTKRLNDMVVVDRTPDDQSRVYFGAWVRLEDESGEIKELRIVGPDEFDPGRAWISMDSPMAKALLGKRLDDEISLCVPQGELVYVIVGIRYSGEDERD